MRNKKGFTLIELLAAIIILAAIMLVAFPILLNTIKNSEKQIDEVTRQLVENAAELYVDENANEYPLKGGTTYCITFDKLIEDKHLDASILETSKVDTSDKVVKVTTNRGYHYEIVDKNSCTAGTFNRMELAKKTIDNSYEFALVDEDGTIWLENEDIDSLYIMFRQEENRWLEIRFTTEGAKKFKAAVQANKNGVLSITCDGEILISEVLDNWEIPEYAMITGDYATLMGWFNKMT